MKQLNTKRTKNLRNWLLPGALGLLLFIITACGDDAAATPETTGAGTSSTETTQTVSIGDSAADQLVAAQERVMINIYRKALPSVVNIQVVQGLEGNDGTRQFPNVPGIPDDFLERGEGSGFVWDDKGRIVTNQHVVDGAEMVTVIFSDRTQVLAKVLGGDKDSDLAVLELIYPKEGLMPIDLGDSDHVLVGQLAVAIGAPFGQSFTMTSAPINPGNSGGPLLDRHGRVVGINTQIISRSGSSAGVGLAVPINIAKMVVPALIEDGKYEYAWLGISGGPVGADVAQLMELPKGTRGALVITVNRNSPAGDGGLTGSDRTEVVNGVQYALGGDTIVGIDGAEIRDMTDLIVYLTKHTRPGDEIMLDVIHGDGSSEQLPVVLGTRPGKG